MENQNKPNDLKSKEVSLDVSQENTDSPIETGDDSIDISLKTLYSIYQKGILSKEEYESEVQEQLNRLKIDSKEEDTTKEEDVSDIINSVSSLSISTNQTSSNICKDDENDKIIKLLEENLASVSICESSENYSFSEIFRKATVIDLGNKKKLREYQKDVILNISTHIQDNLSSVLLHLPTGAGKTMIATSIIKSFMLQKKRVLFIVNRIELVVQAERTFRNCGLENEIGFIKSGYKEDRSKLVQIASIQSLRKREIPQTHIVIFDEAHHCVSESYLKLVDLLKTNEKELVLLGLTATPYRMNEDEDLSTIFSNIVTGPTIGELIHTGVLVSPIVYGLIPTQLRIPLCNRRDKRKTLKEFTVVGISKAMDTAQVTDQAIRHWNTHAKGRRTIVFCVNRKHALSVAKAFNASNIPSASIDGETDPRSRANLFNQLRSKALLVLTSVGVLSEGFDEPLVDSLILLRPTNSKSLYIQQVGRGLRCAENKDDCIVIDIAGNSWRHGMVTNPPEPIDTLESNFAIDTDLTVKRCVCGVILHIQRKRCSVCSYSFERNANGNREKLKKLTTVEQKDNSKLKHKENLKQFDNMRSKETPKKELDGDKNRISPLCSEKKRSTINLQSWKQRKSGIQPNDEKSILQKEVIPEQQ